jgi:hypothetical protein
MDLPLYKYPVVTSFVSFLHFYGDKNNHTILFLCVQNGWAGGRLSSLRKLYGRNHNLFDRIGISVSQMTRICSTCRKYFPVLSSSKSTSPIWNLNAYFFFGEHWYYLRSTFERTDTNFKLELKLIWFFMTRFYTKTRHGTAISIWYFTFVKKTDP